MWLFLDGIYIPGSNSGTAVTTQEFLESSSWRHTSDSQSPLTGNRPICGTDSSRMWGRRAKLSPARLLKQKKSWESPEKMSQKHYFQNTAVLFKIQLFTSERAGWYILLPLTHFLCTESFASISSISVSFQTHTHALAMLYFLHKPSPLILRFFIYSE